MKNKLIEKFLERRGIKLISGKGGDIMLPFFLALLHWDIFASALGKGDEKHEMARVKNLWRSKINNFVRIAMNTYSLEEFDEEYMPEVERFMEYVHDDLVLTKVAVSGCLSMVEDFNKKVKTSDVLVANIVIQIAEKFWEATYHQANPDLVAMDRLSTRYARLYCPVRSNVDLNASEELSKMVAQLCRKIIKYIDKEVK